jgi:hypothetical protein
MSKANPGHLVMENAHCKFSSGELKMACTWHKSRNFLFYLA